MARNKTHGSLTLSGSSAPQKAGLSANSASRRLPRGANSLPPDVVEAAQTRRILEGAAHAVDARGYAAATVADIIRHAGVSRATFYRLFKDKEDCFLFCFEMTSKAHLEVVLTALQADAAPPDRLVGALKAYMSRIDADGAFARAFIAEAEGASPAIVQAFQAARDRLGQELGRWFSMVRVVHKEVPPVSATTLELVQAGLVGFVTRRVRVSDAPLEREVMQIAAYVFASLGLYGWARHVREGRAGPFDTIS